MDDKVKIGISFGIKEIKTLKFNLSNLPEVSNISKDKFKFEVFPATFIGYEESIIGFDVIIHIFIEEPSRKDICELIVRIIYDVINLHEIVPAESKASPQIPEGFMHTLLSISLSTSRGVLFAKTEGSVLNGVSLPILNPLGFKLVKPNSIPQSQI
jgi:hypothetical protein